MPDNINKLFKMLQMEMEDLLEDLNLLEDSQENRFHEKQITNYVYQENKALMEKEKLGIEFLLKHLAEAKNQFTTMDDVYKGLQKYYEKTIRESGYPRSLYMLFRRKITKIQDYMEPA